MRRANGLNVLSRRELLSLAGCAGLIYVAGCTDGDTGAIETGPLGAGGNGNGNGNGNGSGSGNTMPDAGGTMSGADASTMATCGTGAIDVGAPTSFLVDKPVYNSSGFFTVRDSGGIYAVSAKCTHEGAICSLITGEYQCPRHGALFKYDGTIVSGPVSTPLPHYSACLLANGHVGVDKTKVVAKTVRLNA
jgi:nitrite reductase/ring-hydroxylating ferredoxin subunit